MGSAEESPGSEVATSIESTLQDVEKPGVLSTDKTPGGDEEQWKRPVGRLVWFQVCVGIILSAMLYGTPTPLTQRYCLTNFCGMQKVSTQQLRQMSKPLLSNL